VRQALFAVVLVAASFAGGAVVNGPGLRWAQAMVLNRTGLGDEGADHVAPTPAADPAPEPGEKGPDRPAVAAAASPVPAATPALTPPLSPPVDPPSPAPPAGARSAAWQNGSPRKAPRRVSEKPAEPEPSAPAPAEPVPPLLGQTPALEETPPPLDPPVALTTSREAAAPAVETAGDKGKDASVRLVSMAADSDPPAAPAAAPADWAEVRRTMKSLGVSRYGVEGDPNGRARFHCVIPLAGRRAVGQHFEAEGDDDLEAARSALRRVALWRATEAGGRTP